MATSIRAIKQQQSDPQGGLVTSSEARSEARRGTAGMDPCRGKRLGCRNEQEPVANTRFEWGRCEEFSTLVYGRSAGGSSKPRGALLVLACRLRDEPRDDERAAAREGCLCPRGRP